MNKYLNNRHLSFKYAFHGLGYMMRTQPNARIHLAATVLVIMIAVWLQITTLDWALLFIAIGLVWLAEGFNTSMESMVDLVTRDFHPLAKIVKDTSAASVLVASFISLIIGLLILGPPLIQKITGWFH